MGKKNLMSQVAHLINNLTVQDLPIELAELSDEELQQVVGDKEIKYRDGNITGVDDWYKHNT
jgi:bacteriocin-like protein